MRLANKTIVVTGAAAGIGLSMARAFLEEGARVVFSDLERSGDVPADSETVRFVRCDVSDPTGVRELIASATESFGVPGCVVNNAGIGTSGSIFETDDEVWNRTIAVNLSGVFYGTREAARSMRDAGTKGSIINLSSILGTVGLAGSVSYCASKGGVVQVTRAAALDCAEAGIRVNAIAPGFIETKMTDKVRKNEVFMRLVTENTPFARMGSPEDIAAAAVYLASDEARFVTGEVLHVDGGWTAR